MLVKVNIDPIVTQPLLGGPMFLDVAPTDDFYSTICGAIHLFLYMCEKYVQALPRANIRLDVAPLVLSCIPLYL